MAAGIEQAEGFLTEATEKMDAVSKAFDPIIEAFENLKNKFTF